MVMKQLLFNICLLAIFSCPAWGEDTPPPLNFKGIYEFKFSGLPFGRLGIEAAQSPKGYAMTSDITSAGIVSLFAKHTSHTTVEAHGDKVVYDTHYQTKKKKKAVKLVYEAEKIIEEVIVPPENPAKRPPVAPELKNAAYDPLSLNLALRQKIWEAQKSGANNFTLTVFDGRRLTEVDAEIAGKKVVQIGEEKFPAIKLAVRRKLLGGFTQSELDDYNPNEPTLWMYYSDDTRIIPLKIEVGFLFGKITGTLAKECKTGESCLLGIKE
jgi:hypothetical protein